MEHEIYLALQEHNQRLLALEEKVEAVIKATGLKEKQEEEPTPQDATVRTD